VPNCLRSVMAGLDAAIHVSREIREEMDARVKPGHDEGESGAIGAPPRLALVGRVVRLIDGELVEGGLPEVFA
jgi:hypothetical protein